MIRPRMRAGNVRPVGVPFDPSPKGTEPPTVQVVPAFSPQIIIRTLFITVVFVVSLYLIYLLRKPIGWVLIATFLAVALAGPVNTLNRYMRRGFAITIVYFCLLLIPIGIGALIIPPLVTQGNNLIQNLPEYAQDVQDYATRTSGCAGSRPTTTSPRSCSSRPRSSPPASATPPACSGTSASAWSTRSSRCSRSSS